MTCALAATLADAVRLGLLSLPQSGVRRAFAVLCRIKQIGVSGKRAAALDRLKEELDQVERGAVANRPSRVASQCCSRSQPL